MIDASDNEINIFQQHKQDLNVYHIFLYIAFY